jgi:hypothetical protein
MVVYRENGVLYVVRWASRPWLITQADERPPLKLVAIRLVNARLEVAIEDPPLPLTWASPEAYLTEAEAAQWAKRGFGRAPGRAARSR